MGRYIVDHVAGATGLFTAALDFYTLIIVFAIQFTPGRTRATVAAVVGLISLIAGVLALARSSGRLGTGNGRVGAIIALVLGVIGMILSVVHLGTSTTGFGTGGGRAGAIVALVLGLVGLNLGGLALARSRRYARTE